MSLHNVKNYILDNICDRVGFPGFAGNRLRAMSLLPFATNYYLSSDPPFAALTWFPEATYQATVFEMTRSFIAAQGWNYLVLAEQRYPGDPLNRRADILVVDSANNSRLAIELKSDFLLDSVRADIGKLEELAHQGVIALGVALFCSTAFQFGDWMHQLNPNRQAAITPGGIFKD